MELSWTMPLRPPSPARPQAGSLARRRKYLPARRSVAWRPYRAASRIAGDRGTPACRGATTPNGGSSASFQAKPTLLRPKDLHHVVRSLTSYVGERSSDGWPTTSAPATSTHLPLPEPSAVTAASASVACTCAWRWCHEASSSG